MLFNRHIAAGEFGPLAGFFRREGCRLCVRAGDAFAVQGGAEPSLRTGRGGGFPLSSRDGRGDRHVVGFAFAGEFVGDYISMRNAAPALVRIEAMCDSRVLAVGNDRLEAFYRTDAACERLGRRVAERLLLEVYERLLQRYAATPQERYEALLARCPGLLDLVPLQELASFLGVRPETLSRIRRRIR